MKNTNDTNKFLFLLITLPIPIAFFFTLCMFSLSLYIGYLMGMLVGGFLLLLCTILMLPIINIVLDGLLK